MPTNFLITGDPGSGKTTVVKKIASDFQKQDRKVGGIYCPEIRAKGKRKGFKIIDIMTGKSKTLAHVNRKEGPRVSKYRVNVENVDNVSKKAISKALKEADLVVIDEIAPMETYSEEFKKQVKKALNSQTPLLAVIHKRTKSGFIGKIKKREDAELFEINKTNREEITKKLAGLILDALS